MKLVLTMYQPKTASVFPSHMNRPDIIHAKHLPLASDRVDLYDDYFPQSFKAANAGIFNEQQPDFSAFAEAVLAIINKL